MLIYLWEFLYDMISKSPPVYHPYQHIIEIFPRGLCNVTSAFDISIEI